MKFNFYVLDKVMVHLSTVMLNEVKHPYDLGFRDSSLRSE